MMFCEPRKPTEVEAVLPFPWGWMGGVPPQAGDVDLAAELRQFFPAMATQVLEPRRLLLPKSERPQVLKRPFVKVSNTYAKYVARSVAAGTHTLI